MAFYGYVAYTHEGKRSRGKVEAENIQNAKAKLDDKGLITIKLKEEGFFSRDLELGAKRVKDSELSMFCRQMHSVVSIGVPIAQGLEMLSTQIKNKRFAKTLTAVKISLEKGESFADSMKQYDKVFPEILINMIEAGEASGRIEEAFLQMAIHFEKSAKTKAAVKKAMIYPTIILVVAVVVLFVMSVVVIPKFGLMFQSMGSELPGITKFVMGISDFFIYRWYIALAVIVLIVVGFRVLKSNEKGRMFLAGVKLKIPIFGNLSLQNAAALFARTASTLLISGIQLNNVLAITANSMDNLLHKNNLRIAKEQVEKGVNLSEPMEASKLYPDMLIRMLKMGEESGEIENMLEKTADYFEDRVKSLTDGLTTAMEPLMILLLGGMVGFMVLALYMPMIKMYGGMGNL